jgi:hypothetical protein
MPAELLPSRSAQLPSRAATCPSYTHLGNTRASGGRDHHPSTCLMLQQMKCDKNPTASGLSQQSWRGAKCWLTSDNLLLQIHKLSCRSCQAASHSLQYAVLLTYPPLTTIPTQHTVVRRVCLTQGLAVGVESSIHQGHPPSSMLCPFKQSPSENALPNAFLCKSESAKGAPCAASHDPQAPGRDCSADHSSSPKP